MRRSRSNEQHSNEERLMEQLDHMVETGRINTRRPHGCGRHEGPPSSRQR